MLATILAVISHILLLFFLFFSLIGCVACWGVMEWGMIDLCAGRVTYGEKLGYVVETVRDDRIRVKLLVSDSCRTVMYGYQAGTVFFFQLR